MWYPTVPYISLHSYKNIAAVSKHRNPSTDQQNNITQFITNLCRIKSAYRDGALWDSPKHCLNKTQETLPYFLTLTVYFINISCEGFCSEWRPKEERKKFPVSLSLKINLSSLKSLSPPTRKFRQQAVGQNDARHIIQNRWEGVLHISQTSRSPQNFLQLWPIGAQ